MKKALIAATMTGFACIANAQYTGPSGPAHAKTAETHQAVTVQEMLAKGTEDRYFVLRGRITRHVEEDKYVFSDGTGEVNAEIDDKIWPAGQSVNEKTNVEITGKFEKEMIGKAKIEVKALKKL